jgi:Tol biopolymer transport system component
VATAAAIGFFPVQAQATYAATNGAIVFAADVGSGYQLYTLRPNGAGLHQITHVTGDAMNPDWSPNGQRIVFELDLPDNGGCAVHMINPDGTHPRSLTVVSPTICEAQPSFTPDGQHVVFEQFDASTGVDAIWEMNLAGHDRRQVTVDTNSGVTDPNVSPDGRTVSGLRFGSQQLQQALFTWDLNGNHERQLTTFATDIATKSDWSPDGQRLVFTDHADDTTVAANVVTIRPDGSGRRDVTHSTDPQVRAYTGSYSPDGRWIVYRLEDHGQFGLYRIHPDGTHNQAILPLSNFKPRFIDWGPARS